MQIRIYGLIILICALASSLTGSDKQRSKIPGEDEKLSLPVFYYEVGTYPMLSRDSVKVIIKTKVPFDAIQFIKTNNIYSARYELSILIVDENENKSASKIWEQSLQTESFQETNSQQLFDINEVTFHLVPGKYSLIISVLDMDTKKKNIRKDMIETGHFYEKPITISNINIIEQEFTNEKGEIDNISSIEGTVNDIKPEFIVSFNILSDGGPAKITYKIFTTDGKEILSNTVTDTFDTGISDKRLKIDRKNLGYSKYKIFIDIEMGDWKASNDRIFQLRWSGMSKLIDDLDIAIEQVKYIASSKDIKKIKKASPKEKKEKFVRFWEQLDPTPGTEENELMNEYYRRVRHANEHFSGFMEGWKTDMGMIFILFGPPNDIERHPFELDSKPYEIWYYYDINRTFIFVDETGFGDYRLTEPYYDNIFRY
ncbi:GWxTD domain-containing protein [bacterium]|nr:GWxTD domain-containing protein [bacterium]MBU1875050.1 GWxTD domain-containing protein [bacterium]